MARYILLTIWVTVGMVVYVQEHGTSKEINFFCKLINSAIWLAFVYWFAT